MTERDVQDALGIVKYYKFVLMPSIVGLTPMWYAYIYLEALDDDSAKEWANDLAAEHSYSVHNYYDVNSDDAEYILSQVSKTTLDHMDLAVYKTFTSFEGFRASIVGTHPELE